MSKFISRATFVSVAGYAGALAMAQRGLLWDALRTRLGLTDTNRTTVTATGALTVDQCGPLQVDATAGHIVLTLPASGVATDEAVYEVDRIDATAYTVTFAAAGADTIDGAASVLVAGTMTLRLPAGSTVWRVHSVSGATPAKARAALGVSTVKDFNGFIMSTAGSSATMTIGAGEAMDAANADLIVLGSAIAKTTGAWVVGTTNGGKAEAGAVANNTWYHWYAIKRPDTGVEDVCFSTSPPSVGLVAASYVAGGGNVPNAYTSFRWIGSDSTNGFAQWIKFIQNGDYWAWDSPNGTDIYVTDQSTAAILRTLPTPQGIKALAKLSGYVSHTSAAVQVKLYDPALGAQTLAGGHHTALVPSPSGYGGYTNEEVMTNTSSQIYSVASAATTTLLGSVIGYTIRRGRDA